jgi:hypothetical protein
MNTKRSKFKGIRGSWFATNKQGERLPCVHKHWCGDWPNYYDPGIKPGERKKADEFIAAIKADKRVILTSDVIADGSPRATFDRADYIGEYTVDNVVADRRGLRFTFVERAEAA